VALYDRNIHQGGEQYDNRKSNSQKQQQNKKIQRVRTPDNNGGDRVLTKSNYLKLKLPVIIKPGESGYFIAEVPILPGCLSQGKTREEAMANIKEAAELYLETVGKSYLRTPKKYINEIEVTI
jgi:predicted RNase H-like HicB family nuclease